MHLSFAIDDVRLFEKYCSFNDDSTTKYISMFITDCGCYALKESAELMRHNGTQSDVSNLIQFICLPISRQ